MKSGERIGRYRLLVPLRGGMSEAWIAHDDFLARRVVLKSVPANSVDDATALRRLTDEARLLASLEAPGICPVLDVRIVQGRPWVILQYIDGPTLRQVVARHRHAGTSMAVSEALTIVAAIARNLGLAHDSGIVHRDVKPENVILQDRRRPVLLDFGLARDRRLKGSITDPDAIVGTLLYMAPEQFRNRGVSPSTDTFALGIVLYELLTGARPFLPDDVQRDQYRSPRRRRRIVGKSVEGIVAHALAPDQRRRYPDGKAMATAIMRVLKDQEVDRRRRA